jgi:beta-aspartyl-peptidase (threonine type)
MRRLPALPVFALLVLAVGMTAYATESEGPKPRIALVIHGGAGVIERSALSVEDERAIRADLNRALDAGNAVLSHGGAALDAVQAVIEVLEDSPRFNAGKGAVFNAKGRHELDASIMEGHTQRAGAVAGVTTVRHPIQLARAVMEHSKHVMLAGEGAEAFADTRPEIARVRNDWFDTDVRRQQLEKAQAAEKAEATSGVPAMPGGYFGTVGAVALDAQGHIAAATSTGGMTNKRWGRVGDSPIIGAGTWADARCGVSGTGWGEFYIRFAVARDICARVAYRGDKLAAAAEDVVNRIVPAAGGDGGAIALDADGNIAMPFNTSGMYRGWIRPDGSRGVAVFRDED